MLEKLSGGRLDSDGDGDDWDIDSDEDDCGAGDREPFLTDVEENGLLTRAERTAVLHKFLGDMMSAFIALETAGVSHDDFHEQNVMLRHCVIATRAEDGRKRVALDKLDFVLTDFDQAAVWGRPGDRPEPASGKKRAARLRLVQFFLRRRAVGGEHVTQFRRWSVGEGAETAASGKARAGIERFFDALVQEEAFPWLAKSNGEMRALLFSEMSEIDGD